MACEILWFLSIEYRFDGIDERLMSC